MACQCEPCHHKRALFTQCLEDMTRGVGCTKAKIQKSIRAIPENFIHDLRQLLKRLRDSPDATLTRRQQRFLQAIRYPLRRFTQYDPRQMLANKKRIDGRMMPLVQVIGKLLTENPKLMKTFINGLNAH